MAAEAPEPKEVSDFRFRQLRKLKLAKENEKVPACARNTVAASSKYGLLFIGIEKGFKVLKLENILDLNEDKENIRSHAENYYCQRITCDTPNLLAISADDMTLAVCVTRFNYEAADMYDLRSFADQDEMPMPFQNVQLSPTGVQLRDFFWNPVINEMYAYSLSDGCVLVHELVDTTLKVVAHLPPQANATAVCWSPKGKQLVVGKGDGSFSQYKPTLQEVKNIPPPKLEENAVAISSLCWLSTTLFAVLYVPADNKTNMPYLVFVSTPKGFPVGYMNYSDVCYGSGSQTDSRYLMHYESEWGILICASTNSPDIAVIGMNKSTPSVWEQWKLDEGAEAMLPTDKTGESYPLGLSVMYCAQRKIHISDNESYSPMPIIFILSTKGLLVPFHMHNSAPGAANLVYPSEPICKDGVRRNPDCVMPKLSPPAPQPTVPAVVTPVTPKPLQPHIEQSNQGLAKSQSPSFAVPVLKQNSTNQVPRFSGSPSLAFSPTNQQTSFPTTVTNQPPTPAFAVPVQQNTLQQNTPQQNIPQQHILQQNIPQQHILQQNIHQQNVFQQHIQPNISQQNIPQQLPSYQNFARASTPVSAQSPNSFFTSPPQLAPVGFMPGQLGDDKTHKKPLPREASLEILSPPVITDSGSSMRPVAVAQRHLGPIKKVDAKSDQMNTYMAAIFEEISSMNSEIQDLKSTINQSVYIGSKEEMTCLKQSTLLSEDFQTNMRNTMQSLNSDIHSLKNILLESFVMVEDANSRERRKNDNSYITMLKDRALDPMTAKRMQKIDQNYQYLSTQLQEVHDKLDQNYIEFEEKRKENQRTRHPIPSAEAIYRAIVNNQNTIYNLKNQTDRLTKIAKQRKSTGHKQPYNRYMQKLDQRELSKLADTLLQSKMKPSDENTQTTRVAKKLSSEKQTALCEFLANREVSTVKPTVVYTPSQSRLLSRSLLYSRVKRQSKENENFGVDNKPENQIVTEVNNQATSPITSDSQSKFQSAFTTKNPVPFGNITQGLPVSSTVSKNAFGIPQMQEGQLKSENTFSAFTQTFPHKSSVEKPKGGQANVVTTKAVTSQNSSQQNILSNQMLAKVSGSFQSVAMSTPLNTGFAAKNNNFNQGQAFSFIQSRDEFPPAYMKSSEIYYEDITPTGTPNFSEEDYSAETSHLSEEDFNELNEGLISSISSEQPNARLLQEENVFEVTINPDGEAVAHAVTSPGQSRLSSLHRESFSSQIPTDTVFQSFLNSELENKHMERLPSSTSTPLHPKKSEERASNIITVSVGNSNVKKETTTSSNSEVTSLPAGLTISMVQPAVKQTVLESEQPKNTEKVADPKEKSSSLPAKSLFSQPSGSLFGAKSVFGSAGSDSKPLFGGKSVFGSSDANSDSKPLFGGKSVFGSSDANSKSIFGEKFTFGNSDPNAKPLFGQLASSGKATSFFGPKTTVTVTTTTSSALQDQTITTTSSSVFGQLPGRPITATTTDTVNTSTVITSPSQRLFGQTPNESTQPSVFGPSAPSSTNSQLFAKPTVQPATTSPTDSSTQSPTSTSTQEKISDAKPKVESTSGDSQVAVTTTSFSLATSISTPATVDTTSSTTSPSQTSATAAETDEKIETAVLVLDPVESTTKTTEQLVSATTVKSELPTATTTAQPEQLAIAATPSTQTTSSVIPAFGQSAPSLFSPASSTTTTTLTLFGQPATTTSPAVFGQAVTTTVTDEATPKSPFNQQSSSAPSIFGAASPPTSGVAPLFGQKSNETSFFGQPAAATTQSSFFSKPASETSVFGQSQGSVFGQSVNNASGTFIQVAGSFFSQTASKTSVFGGGAGAGESSSFGQSASSGFAFGKVTFGQNTSSFGLAKSVFGSPTFGQSSTSPEPTFGQGSIFGIGGKPSAENASKNVFGSGSLNKQSGNSAGIFGNEGALSFGSKPTGSFSSGSFSAGGGSVAQSGFGSFQQSPQKPGGFGTSPAFGSSPSFGSPPAFGAIVAPTSPIAGSVFGGQQAANFSNFAAASSPTFGSLASQGPGFGSAQTPALTFGQQQSSSPFGSVAVFGSSPSFGGQQSTFGSPGSPPSSNTSAFTQWRN